MFPEDELVGLKVDLDGCRATVDWAESECVTVVCVGVKYFGRLFLGFLS